MNLVSLESVYIAFVKKDHTINIKTAQEVNFDWVAR